MKKIMIAAAALAVAGMAQAASFTWGATGLNTQNLAPGDAGYCSVDAVMFLYVYTGAGTFGDGSYNFNTGALTASDSTTASLVASFPAAYNWNVGSFSFNFAAPEGSINTTYAIVAYDPTGSATYYGVSTLTVAGLTDMGAAGNYSAASINAGQYVAVPEPATGMLALAGAALLLRRRRRA
jgi:hypothetical protein